MLLNGEIEFCLAHFQSHYLNKFLVFKLLTEHTAHQVFKFNLRGKYFFTDQ